MKEMCTVRSGQIPKTKDRDGIQCMPYTNNQHLANGNVKSLPALKP